MTFETAWGMLIPMSADWYIQAVKERSRRLHDIERKQTHYTYYSEDILNALEDNFETDNEIIKYLNRGEHGR